MKELLDAALTWTTLPFTIILGMAGLYWIVCILGLIDMEFLDGIIDFDLDIDMDGDIDLDMDMDMDADVDAPHASFLGSILRVFHFAEVPMMIPLTFFALFAWIIALLGNYYFNVGGILWIAAVILVVNLLVSGVLMRFFCKPFAVLFQKMNAQTDAPAKIIGMPCTLTMKLSPNKMGQAEIRFKGSSILLNVIMAEGSELNKGDEAVVVSRDKEKDVYTIKPLDLET